MIPRCPGTLPPGTPGAPFRGVTPGDDNADMSVSGILIAESLLKGSPLEGVTLQVRKISRGDVGDVGVGQPLTWTFIEFEVQDQLLTDLIGALTKPGSTDRPRCAGF